MLDLSYAIGMTVAILLLTAAAITLVIAIRKVRGTSPNDPGMTRMNAGLAIFAAIFVAVPTLVITPIATWPTFGMQYHTWRPVSGTVASVHARLRADGKATTQSYAIRFTGDPTIYRCDDTRCALTKPGTRLRLQCKRDWQYASTPGWDCRYDQAN